MNSLFGDATTMAPTPETLAEAESLFGDARSPVPSFRLGDDRVDGSNIDPNVPDLDIDPPAVEVQDGKPVLSKDNDEREEGVGGWISNLVKKGNGDAGSGKYKRVGQQDE